LSPEVQGPANRGVPVGTPVGTSFGRKLQRSDVTGDLRTFLRKYNVQTVLVSHISRSLHVDPTVVVTKVTAAIGPPVTRDGMTVCSKSSNESQVADETVFVW
jgi:hypothetical protein